MWWIAEHKIQQAIEDGAFDRLPGRGKPLPADDLAHLPDELRMAYRILRNAGYIPEGVSHRKEIQHLQALMHACDDLDEQQRLRRRLTLKQLSYDLWAEKRGLKSGDYGSKLEARLTRS